MIVRIDLANKRFGMLVSLEDVGSTKGQRMWLCQCDCGNKIKTSAARLLSGGKRNCGCLRVDEAKRLATKHGAKANKKPTTEYISWSSMRDRCNNKNNKNYKYYGGRGISVCERWDDFSKFLEDMGEKPPLTTLDRSDVDGNYEPSNCRWATRKEQARNRRYCKRVLWNGESRLLWQLAEEHGIEVQIVHHRLCRGWDLTRAITQKKRIGNDQNFL